MSFQQTVFPIYANLYEQEIVLRTGHFVSNKKVFLIVPRTGHFVSNKKVFPIVPRTGHFVSNKKQSFRLFREQAILSATKNSLSNICESIRNETVPRTGQFVNVMHQSSLQPRKTFAAPKLLEQLSYIMTHPPTIINMEIGV